MGGSARDEGADESERVGIEVGLQSNKVVTCNTVVTCNKVVTSNKLKIEVGLEHNQKTKNDYKCNDTKIVAINTLSK